MVKYFHVAYQHLNLFHVTLKKQNKQGLTSRLPLCISGIIHQMKGEYETALKRHKAHLSFAQELGDYAAQGRAYGNMGNAYHALGIYDQAVRYHRQELQISLEVNTLALHGHH